MQSLRALRRQQQHLQDGDALQVGLRKHEEAREHLHAALLQLVVRIPLPPEQLLATVNDQLQVVGLAMEWRTARKPPCLGAC